MKTLHFVCLPPLCNAMKPGHLLCLHCGNAALIFSFAVIYYPPKKIILWLKAANEEETGSVL